MEMFLSLHGSMDGGGQVVSLLHFWHFVGAILQQRKSCENDSVSQDLQKLRGSSDNT